MVKLVQDSDLSDSAKSTWIARITKEGLTQDVLDELKDAFQAEIDAGFEKLGVDISNTPEYKEREAAMVAQIEAIQADFDQKMAQNTKLLNDLQANASQVMDAIKTEEVKASME